MSALAHTIELTDGPIRGLSPRVLERFDRSVAAGDYELPLLSETVQKILAATRDDRVDARKLADLLHKDASLAAHVLRVAASPHYLGGPVSSLQQAVSRLGMRAIREIAITVSFQARVFRAVGYESEVRELFRHALATAFFAQEIARRRRWNVEEAFLQGLFHDVGKPVLLQLLVDCCAAEGVPLDELAASFEVEARHAQVGAAIATRFLVNDRIAQAVLHHHSPIGEPPQGAPLTSFADHLANFATTGAVDDKLIRHDPMLPILNLYPEDLDALLARRSEVIQSVRGMS